MNYNDSEAVSKYVHDLTTLHNVITRRKAMHKTSNTALSAFKLFNNQLYFDTSGNAWIHTGSNGLGDTYENIPIPTDTDICSHCGKGFNIQNIAYIFTDNNGVWYHSLCNTYKRIKQGLDAFQAIFSSVYNLDDLDFVVIPNEYSDWPGYIPWFLVKTPDGDIKIGWRKRVIQITWESNYLPFTESFESEDVTKVFNNIRLIHAWSVEECIEYISKAKNSIAHAVEPDTPEVNTDTCICDNCQLDMCIVKGGKTDYCGNFLQKPYPHSHTHIHTL